VDTDLIISGKFLTLRDPDGMAKHVFGAVRPDFASQVMKGDLLVAGKNFGCGSSREEAPTLLKRLGIGGVVAAGFARLFFRNSVNIGLPVLECKGLSGKVLDGDIVEADLEMGVVRNISRKVEFETAKLPVFLLDILQAGGAVEAYRKRKG